MRKNFTLFNRFFVLIMLVNICSHRAFAEWGNGKYCHFIEVRTCDSTKGLVYADTIENAVSPTYKAQIDLKWTDEYDPFDDMEYFHNPYGYALPLSGYVFTGWSKNDASGTNAISFDNPALFSLEDKYYTDEYSEEPDEVFYAFFGKTAVQVEAESRKFNLGTVSMDKYLNSTGDKITLTATPAAENITFTKWVLDGKTVSTDNILIVTASETPQVYYAYFETESIRQYDFNKDGEWKVYYHPCMNAQLPTNAIAAYSIPSCCFDEETGTYYLLKSDILKPGTPYLIYGQGEGTIEYFNFEPEEEYEFPSRIEYLAQDKELECSWYGEYYLFNIETGEFDKLEEGVYNLPKGSAYIYTQYWGHKEYDAVECLGELDRTIELTTDSYYCKDILTGWEGYIEQPSSIKMEFAGGARNVNYKILNFFDHECGIMYAEPAPGANGQFLINGLNEISFFNYFINSDLGYPIDLYNYSAWIWAKKISEDGTPIFGNDDEIENDNVTSSVDTRTLKISKDENTGKYTMDDFYIIHLRVLFNEEAFDSQTTMLDLKHLSQITLNKKEATDIEDIIANNSIEYYLEGTDIVLSETTHIKIYSLNGNLVRDCKSDRISGLPQGFYVVHASDKAFKVAIR